MVLGRSRGEVRTVKGNGVSGGHFTLFGSLRDPVTVVGAGFGLLVVLLFLEGLKVLSISDIVVKVC